MFQKTKHQKIFLLYAGAILMGSDYLYSMRTPEVNRARWKAYYEKNKENLNSKKRQQYDPAKEKLRRIKYKESTRKRRFEKRRYIKEQLLNIFGNKCKQCGFSGTGAMMEFHHRDRTQKAIDVHSCTTLEKAVIEAVKCDLLCVRCHRIREHAYLEFRRALLDALQDFPEVLAVLQK